MSFPLFLALKYLKPKRSVASVITLVSVLGVMLGITAVVVVRRRVLFRSHRQISSCAAS